MTEVRYTVPAMAETRDAKDAGQTQEMPAREGTIRLAIVHGSKVLVTLIWVILIGYGASLVAASFTPWWVQLITALVGPTSITVILGRLFWKYRAWARRRIGELEAKIVEQEAQISALEGSWFGADQIKPVNQGENL